MSIKTNKKSIMFFINTLDVGGAAKILKYVAELTYRNGYNVILVSLFKSDKIRAALPIGIQLIDLDMNSFGYCRRLKILIKIRRLVKKLNPNIICSFISDVAFMCRLATIGLRITYISAERGDPYTMPLKWQLPVKWAYNKSDYCIFQLKKAMDYFGDNLKKKSYVIPNPYATNELVKPYDGVREKTIISVGRFDNQKGYDVLIKAFAKFLIEEPDYRLIIYGDGELRECLLKTAEAIGVVEKVEMPGYISNVSEKIRKAGIFVLSSRFEGIPNSLIEAMSLGIPTISTDCTPGGPAFLTDNGRRGLLVPVDDEHEMVKAMIRIASDSVLAKKLSNEGKEIVDILNPEIIENEWLGVFETAISRYNKS